MAKTKFREGKHFRFKKLEFWAERGLINIIDERYNHKDDKAHEVITVREWLLRLQAISAEIKRHTLDIYSDERMEYIRLFEDGVKAAKQAKDQGRPDDPKALAEMMRSRRRNYVLNNRQSAVLHTTSSEGTYEGSLLPPVPNHPDVLAEKKSNIVIPGV